MAEPFKNMFNSKSVGEFATAIKSVYNSFKKEEFLKSIFDETWDSLELKARGRKICMSLGEYLPKNYSDALDVIDKVVSAYKGICLFSFTDYVEVYGQNDSDLELSISALGRYTQYSSSEFAVRPFIIKHQKRMMDQMYAWSKDENEHIRRLSSEGCRPQLPWGQVLTEFKKDPSPILPILEQLKTDSSLYVRKSVANNLNDISKTHPDIVIKIANEWHGKNEHTDWILKHGLRTLLKKGNRDALALFGYDDVESVKMDGFALDRKVTQIGGDIVFSFTVSVKEATKTRLEYAIDYVKSNGKRSRKIFQISEIPLKKDETRQYTKKHSFMDLTTRRHYPGKHSITLIVNGIDRGTLDFELK